MLSMTISLPKGTKIFPFSPFSMKEEEIDYKKMVHDLNWVNNPHRPVPPEVVKVSSGFVKRR